MDDYIFDVPDGMDLMHPTAQRLSRSEMTVDMETRPHVDNDLDDPDLVEIRRDVRNLPDAFLAIFDKTAAVPMTLPVDVEMGPQVDNDPDDPDLVDIRRDVRNLPDAVPAIFDKTAAVPLSLPVVVETGPQVGCDSDLLLSERDMEVDDMDVNRDIRLLTDVCPMRFEESATVQLSSAVMDVAVLRDGSILNLTVV